MMSLAILTLSPHTGWTKGIKYSHKKIIHGAMQVIGAVLAISGSAVIMGANFTIDPFLNTKAHSVCGKIEWFYLEFVFNFSCLYILSSMPFCIQSPFPLGWPNSPFVLSLPSFA